VGSYQPGKMTLPPLVMCPCCRVLRHPVVTVSREQDHVIHTYRCDTCHCVVHERLIETAEEADSSSPVGGIDLRVRPLPLGRR
jgi:hypothetical protein